MILLQFDTDYLKLQFKLLWVHSTILIIEKQQSLVSSCIFLNKEHVSNFIIQISLYYLYRLISFVEFVPPPLLYDSWSQSPFMLPAPHLFFFIPPISQASPSSQTYRGTRRVQHNIDAQLKAWTVHYRRSSQDNLSVFSPGKRVDFTAETLYFEAGWQKRS